MGLNFWFLGVWIQDCVEKGFRSDGLGLLFLNEKIQFLNRLDL